MRIITFITLLLVFATISLQAQNISDHTLGLRLGDSDGFGAEISYQRRWCLGFKSSVHREFLVRYKSSSSTKCAFS